MKDLRDVFGRYFLIAGFLPAITFFALVRFLIAPHLKPEWQKSLETMLTYDLGPELVMAVLISLIFATLLVNLGPQFIRIFSLDFKRIGVRQQVKDEHDSWTGALDGTMELLLAADDPEQRRAYLSDAEGVLKQIWALTGGAMVLDPKNLKSTRLGNVFAAMYEYPERRYGMRMKPMWPRLLTVLPKEFEDRIRSQNTSFMFLLNMIACSLFFAALWILLGAFSLPGWVRVSSWVWVVVLVLDLLVVYPLYRLAVSEAEVLAEDVMTAFDLYRGDLLQRYRAKAPETIGDEASLWRELALFIILGDGRLYPDYQKSDEKNKSA